MTFVLASCNSKSSKEKENQSDSEVSETLEYNGDSNGDSRNSYDTNAEDQTEVGTLFIEEDFLAQKKADEPEWDDIPKVEEDDKNQSKFDVDPEKLKPLFKTFFGLDSEESNQLFAFKAEMDKLKGENKFDGPEGDRLRQQAYAFIDELKKTKPKTAVPLNDLKSIFRKSNLEKKRKDSLRYVIRESLRQIPQEFLRADGVVDVSYIEAELRKEEFYLIIEKFIEENKQQMVLKNLDDAQLAELMEVTEEEYQMLKETPAQTHPKTASEAEELAKGNLSEEIEQQLKKASVSEKFTERMKAQKKKQVVVAKKFLANCKRAETKFYKENPNWYSNKDGLSEVYLSDHDDYVFLPLGKLSFADQVISFDRGDGASSANPNAALNEPDYDRRVQDYSKMCNLGTKGVLTFQFVDNVLIDVNGPDLFVFEVGAIEPTLLEISKDGQNWVNIGKIEGGTAQIDIAPFINPGDTFNYVRFTDLDTYSAVPGADIDAVATIGGALRLSLDSAVLFDTGKFELKPAGVTAVKALATQIKSIPKGTISVDGHTDNVGSIQSNMTLSKKRAASVAKILRQELGEVAFKWKENGYGEGKPLVPNTTDENKQKNRRVEILVTPF
ncbi:OmpA family protein [Croceivirga sp. JEA036]|uniref:OmpA family protein n=1 Tax=Croceivirga sp. JEA036 TaxID=2721162 RepID=UPI00143CBD4F|nr:OmpA family protein [Croceivirga sp. JEA036]NJB37877.1 OmpA family protein [Croceivirga sp. JEA036]